MPESLGGFPNEPELPAAVGVGLLVGLAAGKLGGRNMVLPAVAAVLALAAVHLGKLTFIALATADHESVGVSEVIDKIGVSGLHDAWKEGVEAVDFLFLAIGGFVAFGAAKKAGNCRSACSMRR